ncbi:hypothetical protein ACVIRO_005847 [Rhizobium ruizarguesonis]
MQTSVPSDDQSAHFPPLDPEAIRVQFERIVASPGFPKVGRSATFLTYVVQDALEGRGDRIKGYTIAVEVFWQSSRLPGRER